MYHCGGNRGIGRNRRKQSLGREAMKSEKTRKTNETDTIKPDRLLNHRASANYKQTSHQGSEYPSKIVATINNIDESDGDGSRDVNSFYAKQR
jgi:hypothetical protein